MASLVSGRGSCASLGGISTDMALFFDCIWVDLDTTTQLASVVCVVDSMTLRVVVVIVALV